MSYRFTSYLFIYLLCRYSQFGIFARSTHCSILMPPECKARREAFVSQLYNTMYLTQCETKYFVSEARARKTQGNRGFVLEFAFRNQRLPVALRILRTNGTGSKGSAWLYCVLG